MLKRQSGMSACVCARKRMTRLVCMVGWVDGCGVGRTLDLCVCVCVCVCSYARALMSIGIQISWSVILVLWVVADKYGREVFGHPSRGNPTCRHGRRRRNHHSSGTCTAAAVATVSDLKVLATIVADARDVPLLPIVASVPEAIRRTGTCACIS